MSSTSQSSSSSGAKHTPGTGTAFDFDFGVGDSSTGGVDFPGTPSSFAFASGDRSTIGTDGVFLDVEFFCHSSSLSSSSGGARRTPGMGISVRFVTVCTLNSSAFSSSPSSSSGGANFTPGIGISAFFVGACFALGSSSSSSSSGGASVTPGIGISGSFVGACFACGSTSLSSSSSSGGAGFFPGMGISTAVETTFALALPSALVGAVSFFFWTASFAFFVSAFFASAVARSCFACCAMASFFFGCNLSGNSFENDFRRPSCAFGSGDALRARSRRDGCVSKCIPVRMCTWSKVRCVFPLSTPFEFSVIPPATKRPSPITVAACKNRASGS